MNLATRLRIEGTPIECEYAPVLPISSRRLRARSRASLGKISLDSGWLMRSGYSVNAEICERGEQGAQSQLIDLQARARSLGKGRGRG